MSANSKTEWTDATWNPVRALDMRGAKPGVTPAAYAATLRSGWHCEHVSEGCRNCYAEGFNRRLGTGFDCKPGTLAPRGPVEVFLDETMLLAPLRWRKPRRIFVGSMTDLFAGFVTDAMLDRVFAVMALAPQHTFQLLTKRPERMRAYLQGQFHRRVARVIVDWLIGGKVNHGKDWPVMTVGGFDDPEDIIIRRPLPNVWLGTSVEDQAAADARVPELLATPAAKRFLSCEPMLGPVDLTSIDLPGGWNEVFPLGQEMFGRSNVDDDGNPMSCIDWVIVGGESGPGARPMDLAWVRSLVDQCRSAGVPAFVKQLSSGGAKPIKDIGDFPEDLRVREFPNAR